MPFNEVAIETAVKAPFKAPEDTFRHPACLCVPVVRKVPISSKERVSDSVLNRVTDCAKVLLTVFFRVRVPIASIGQ
jgi:hypothetical protein